jgi:hypothetical protein
MIEFPLEFALVAFEGNEFTGDIVPELLDLAEREIVRFVDIVFIRKDEDGGIRTVELNDLEEEMYRLFNPLGEHVDSIFTEEDLAWAADQLPENSSAALFLWENVWMNNIRKAILASGGRLIETGRISAEAIEQE